MIGNTPMLKLNHFDIKEGVNIYAKLELMNPGGSVKDRVGEYMIKDAEERGILKPGGTIVIPTYIHFNRSVAANVFNKAGAGFKRHFDEDNYKEFFRELGVGNVRYKVCEGRMSCDVAVFENI